MEGEITFPALSPNSPEQNLDQFYLSTKAEAVKCHIRQLRKTTFNDVQQKKMIPRKTKKENIAVCC